MKMIQSISNAFYAATPQLIFAKWLKKSIMVKTKIHSCIRTWILNHWNIKNPPSDFPVRDMFSSTQIETADMAGPPLKSCCFTHFLDMIFALLFEAFHQQEAPRGHHHTNVFWESCWRRPCTWVLRTVKRPCISGSSVSPEHRFRCNFNALIEISSRSWCGRCSHKPCCLGRQSHNFIAFLHQQWYWPLQIVNMDDGLLLSVFLSYEMLKKYWVCTFSRPQTITAAFPMHTLPLYDTITITEKLPHQGFSSPSQRFGFLLYCASANVMISSWSYSRFCTIVTVNTATKILIDGIFLPCCNIWIRFSSWPND